MANMCHTTYTLVWKPTKGMHEKLLTRFGKVSNGEWIGHFLSDVGIDPSCVECRGWIMDFTYNEDEDELVLNCETSWTESMEWRRNMEEHYGGDLTIFYVAEEYSMLYFTTNIPDLEFPYVADNENPHPINGCSQEDFKTALDLLKYVCVYIGADMPECEEKDAYEVAEKMANDYSTNAEDDYIGVGHFMYVA